jgi:hypothetical protein
MSDALTPSLRIVQDKFDDTIMVLQPPVSSASSLSEGWTMMGFEWQQRNPDVIYVTAGMSGIASVMGIQFRADGNLIDTAKRTNKLTDINANQSMSRFEMPFDDFVTIANASDVRMRVDSIDEYVVSTFGKSNEGAVVNTKFAPFLAKIQELRASPSG